MQERETGAAGRPVQHRRLVLRGGTVIDPVSGTHAVADVAVADGLVSQIGPDLADSSGEMLDCRGAFVVPGLIDYHTHLFNAVTTHGAPVDEACLQRGVMVAVDAGSAGCLNYAAFERFIVDPAPVRVFCFLNIAAFGMPDPLVGELRLLDYVLDDRAVQVAAEHPGVVKGFKVRLGEKMVGGSCLPALRRARAIGDASGLPLMLHIGESEESLPEILEYLKPGDVVSHCYTGLPNGILGGHGTLLSDVRDARSAGILFDPAHGSSNFSFDVARRAIESGFLPDTISSDNSLRNWRGPVYDLATTMSKFLALGLSIDQVVERVTILPARILGIDDEGAGSITPGRPADITVLRLTEDAFDARDATRETLSMRRLEPIAALHRGAPVQLAQWRGAATAG